jgi:hypothetical protein
VSELLDKVHERIRKLLSLAQSNNVNEATLAMAKAQDLMFKYNLSMHQVTQSAVKSKFIQERFDMGISGSENWRRNLIGIISEFNFCTAVIIKRDPKAVVIVGESHNITTVIWLYTYILRQIVKLGNQFYNNSGSTENRRSWLNSFYFGAINKVYDRLEAQRSYNLSKYNTGKAMVLSKESELDDALKSFFPNTKERPPVKLKSHGGYEMGQIAGEQVSLNKVLQK